MKDQSRLLIVHPFIPPHIMPLIEVVPSPNTNPEEVAFARRYFEEMGSGHRPIFLHKEVPSFVGYRLTFALFQEACSLVDQDFISPHDLGLLVEASLAQDGLFRDHSSPINWEEELVE